MTEALTDQHSTSRQPSATTSAGAGRSMIHKFSVRAHPELMDAQFAGLREYFGIDDVQRWTEYYVEFARALTPEELAALGENLRDPMVQFVVIDEPLDADTMVQVAHRRGIIDNESESVTELCRLLSVPAVAAKAAHTYVSSDGAGLLEHVRTSRFNPNIEELHLAEPRYETLLPAGFYEPPRTYDLRNLSTAELEALGREGGRNLDLRQMRRMAAIQAATGSESVSDVLLEALDARWSDHCSHSTWRSHGNLLRRLVEASRATDNANIVGMFHDNAGVWEFYDGWSIAIKPETHNGPCAISAYFGQLSKLGGVLRDILGTGLGADPIGCFEYLATGEPAAGTLIEGRPTPRQIVHDTIRGIKEYANTFGVPMTSSRMTFHPRYHAKPFALGGSIGLVPTAYGRRGTPESGDVIVLIGSLTGNDGIHGASASSAGATMEGASVQIGSPLEEVKFRKAIVDLRDAGCLRAITDLGAAGLNSAVGEMGEACGAWINTARVPLKSASLPMWCILLSETQERMLLAIPPTRLPEAREILTRHSVRTSVIGRFVDTGRYAVFHNPAVDEESILAAPRGEAPADLGDLGFDLPYDQLDDDPPQVEVGAPPDNMSPAVAWPSISPDEVAGLFEAMMSDLELASQAYADDQYDSTVQGNTRYGPHYGSPYRVPTGYWAATPLDGSPAAVVLSTAFDPWLFERHPVRALRQMFVRSLAVQVLAGVRLEDICLCDNFYTPDLDPHGGAWLVAMVDELAQLVRHFGTPVISGKDSSAGSTRTPSGIHSVPPAVFFTALGKVPDAGALLGERWQRPGNVLVQIGLRTPSSAGTVASKYLDVASDFVDDFDDSEALVYLRTLQATRADWPSGTPIGRGGIAARLVLGSLASGLGVDVMAEIDPPGLVMEHRLGALMEVPPELVDGLPAEFAPQVVGVLGEGPGVRVGGREILTDALATGWLRTFERAVA